MKKMWTKKVIETSLETYFVYVEVDPELEQYRISIYDVDPEVRFFGIPIRTKIEPVMEGVFDVQEPIQEKVVELIRKYELPYSQLLEFDQWNPETTTYIHDWKEGTTVHSKQILDDVLEKTG